LANRIIFSILSRNAWRLLVVVLILFFGCIGGLISFDGRDNTEPLGYCKKKDEPAVRLFASR
jgi:hypothetical protein